MISPSEDMKTVNFLFKSEPSR